MKFSMVVLKDIFIDTAVDSIRMLPFLFAAFVLLELLEHYSNLFMSRTLSKIGKSGPFIGALFGAVPQCGFSVMASNLYAGGVLSVGTLLSVFLATSDEAVIILLGHPGQGTFIVRLLATKIIIAIAAGYLIDGFFSKRITVRKQISSLCSGCGCGGNHSILIPALNHTVKLFVYIFLFSGILNFIIEVFGLESLSAILLKDSILQPLLAALIGFIPNCAASVILTELYLGRAISFASLVAGLCANAGIALVVLFKVNDDRKENLKITGLLYAVSVCAGLLISLGQFLFR